MLNEIRKVEGEKAGFASLILGGVHGDEPCGVEAIGEVFSGLDISSGKVYFGYGNPRAISAQKRFIDANLNRLFVDEDQLSEEEKDSCEHERAQHLKKYLDKSEVLLDLHASKTPSSPPFIICEENAEDLAKCLPAEIIVSGFDDIQPGGTDYYMNKSGGIGICLECGYANDPKSTRVAKEGIISFLKAQDHLRETPEPTAGQSHVHIYDRHLTQTDNFQLTKQYDDFEKIAEDEVLGVDGGENIQAPQDSIILFARDCDKADEQAFMLGKKKSSLT